MILWMILLPKRNVYEVPNRIRMSSPLLSQFSFPKSFAPLTSVLHTIGSTGKCFLPGASRGPLPAPLSPGLCVPAQLEQDAVITSAVKGFVSLKGSEDVASTANEEMSFPFRASGGCKELWDVTQQDSWSFIFLGRAVPQRTHPLPSSAPFF